MVSQSVAVPVEIRLLCVFGLLKPKLFDDVLDRVDLRAAVLRIYYYILSFLPLLFPDD